MSAATSVAIDLGGNATHLRTDSQGNLLTTAVGTLGSAITIADGSDATEGSKADSVATNSTGSWSVISLLKGMWQSLSGVSTVTNQNSQIILLNELVLQLVSRTGTTISFTYNADGTVATYTDVNGVIFTFHYSAGQLISVTS